MTISKASTLVHTSPCREQVDPQNDLQALKEIFIEELRKKGELDKANVGWLDEETIEMDKVFGLCLHSFLLRAEELGKDISITQKTIFKIS